MSHRVRVTLVEELPSDRKNGRVIEHVLESIEVDVQDKKEGVDLVDDLAGYLEEEHEKEVFECD
jgi:hypothetical protein